MPSSTPPIGVRSIEITTFRRIDALRLDFLGPSDSASEIAVLAGPNGCGKTSVLEACLIALGYEGNLQGARGPDAARHGSRDWTIQAEVQTPHGVYHVTTRSNGHAEWQNLNTREVTRPVAIPCMYFSSWRAPKLVGSLPITAGRPGKRPKDTEQNRLWRAKQHLIDSKAHALMLHSLMNSQQQLFEDDYVSDLKRLNAVWDTFHPQSEEVFTVEPVSRDPSAGFDVFLCCRDGRKVPVDALSSGQLELFAFFGALMLAKFTDGVIVIDEPELHLDPQWHALMLRAIRRFLPSAQLIVATHSPRVYDSVLSFQRHFLVPENDPRATAWNLRQGGVPVA
ncbi:MAG: AAA family ATPase [Gemmataceae bacterium]